MTAARYPDDALCAQVGGDDWFPKGGRLNKGIRAVCASCTVSDACLEFALAHDVEGIWAGTTPGDRARIQRARKRAEKENAA